MKRATASVWLALLAAAVMPVSAARAELKPIVLRPAAAPVLPLDDELETADPASQDDGAVRPSDEQPVLLPPPPTQAKVRRLATDLPVGEEAAEDKDTQSKDAVQLAAHQQPRVQPQRVFRLLGLTPQVRQKSVSTQEAIAVNPLRSGFEPAAGLRESFAPVAARVADTAAPVMVQADAPVDVKDNARFEPSAFEPVKTEADDIAASEERSPVALVDNQVDVTPAEDAQAADRAASKPYPAAAAAIENTFIERPRSTFEPVRIPALLDSKPGDEDLAADKPQQKTPAPQTNPFAAGPVAGGSPDTQVVGGSPDPTHSVRRSGDHRTTSNTPTEPLPGKTNPFAAGLSPFIKTGGAPAGKMVVNNTLREDSEETPAKQPASQPALEIQPAAPPTTVDTTTTERAKQLAAAQLERSNAWQAAPAIEKTPAADRLPLEPAVSPKQQDIATEPSTSTLPALAAAVKPAAPPRHETFQQPPTAPVEQSPLREPAPRSLPAPNMAVWEAPQQQQEQLHAQADPRNVALTRFQDQNQDQAAPLEIGPFQVIEEESQAIEVQVRRSKLLRTQFDIYRTAVVDASICEVAQFTPREAAIIGKGEGATNVTFWFEGEQRPVTYLVRVKPDIEEVEKVQSEYELLEKMLAQHFPDSKVTLSVIADKVLVKGQAKDSEEAAQILAIVRNQANSGNVIAGNRGLTLGAGQAADVLGEDATGRPRRRQLQVINMLRVPGVQQVALRVKIAELNRSAARGFGVDVSGPNDGPAIINFSDNPDGSALFLQSLLNVAAGNAPALLTQFDGDDIQIGIRYLQQHGVLRLLSEPTLVTLSGRPATFVAGGEFAVPTVVGSAGLNAVTTDFRAFGVIISFMPTVVDKDRIRLQVAPEFSQVNSDLTVNDTPGLNVRAVTTTVEMREGQTLAIAGLLEDTMSGTNTGDIPFLAKLLGRRNMSRNETELLILVTPELVQPMDPEETPPLPGFDVTEPTNGQFFLHGDLEGNPTSEYRSTVWPRLNKRYRAGGPAMISGPFGHGQ